MLGKSTLQSAFGHWKGITRASKEGSEVWAPVGESQYLVSTFGNVKNGNTGLVLKPGVISSGYLKVKLCYDQRQKQLLVHRLVAAAFISNPDDKPQVDHMDNNRLNNHFSNLRYATRSENGMNKCMQSNNNSGVVGVRFHRNKWCAEITMQGKTRHIGCLATKEEAVAARTRVSNELFGEFTHSSQKVA